MNKPKKPLRGLFASTEAPAKTPVRNPIPIPMPSKDGPQGPQSPSKPKMPPERLAPPPRIKQTPPNLIMESSTPEASIPDEPIAPITLAAEIPETTVVTETIETIETKVLQPELSQGEMRIMNVQYNFDAMKTVRETWLEQDYALFLKRLDQLQTEAFILRGKLLFEAKQRFFETNKQGWIEFCDAHLGMNYTTANQYIRVASEFDVTSHHRPDFGFEHFKAMLPLTVEERSLFTEGGQTWSVKSIRNKVKEILSSKPSENQINSVKEIHRQSMRFIRSLQNLKSEIEVHADSFRVVSQTQRWQISAACQNIAAHLNHLARTLNDLPVSESPVFASAPARAGAFGTAEGVAQMEDVVLTKELPESQFKN